MQYWPILIKGIILTTLFLHLPLSADWDFGLDEVYKHHKWTKQYGDLEFKYYFLPGYEHGILNAYYKGHIIHHEQGVLFEILGEDYYPDLPAVYTSGNDKYVYVHKRANGNKCTDFILVFVVNNSTPRHIKTHYLSHIKKVEADDSEFPIFTMWRQETGTTTQQVTPYGIQ